MALEEATDAKLPFGMGEIDLTSSDGLFAIVALILGATVWSLANSVGSNLARNVAQFISNNLGYNPATGESSGNAGLPTV